MNFRELFSKLDSISEGGITLPNPDGSMPPGAFTAKDQMALNQRVQAQMAAQSKAKPVDTPPGAQPSLAPKDDKPLTAQDLKALQFPNQKPDATPATYTDPKRDIEMMKAVRDAVANQSKQPMMQPNTSASTIQQQKDVQQQPRDITTPKPGEPLEEYELSEADQEFKPTKKKSVFTRATQSQKQDRIDSWEKYVRDSKDPTKIAEVPEKIRIQVAKRLGIDPNAPPAVIPTAVVPADKPPAQTDGNKTPPPAQTGDNKTTPPAQTGDNKDNKPPAQTGDNKDNKPPAQTGDNKDNKPPAQTGDNKDNKPPAADADNKKKKPVGTDGPTGLALAKFGITRDNRRNQEFVDKAFGKDKYVAGTAASNYALLQWAKDGKKPPEALQGTDTNTNLPVKTDGNKDNKPPAQTGDNKTQPPAQTGDNKTQPPAQTDGNKVLAPAPVASLDVNTLTSDQLRALNQRQRDQEAADRREAEVGQSKQRMNRAIDPDAIKSMKSRPKEGDYYVATDLFGNPRLWYYKEPRSTTDNTGGWQSFRGYHPDMKHLAPTAIVKDLQNNKLLPQDEDEFYNTVKDTRGFFGRKLQDNPNYISGDKVLGPTVSLRTDPKDPDYGTPEWWKNPRNSPLGAPAGSTTKSEIDTKTLSVDDARKLNAKTMAANDGEVSDAMRQAGSSVKKESLSSQLRHLAEQIIKE